MIRKALVLASALATTAFAQGASAQVQGVQWDTESPSAILAGTGCQKNLDSFMGANGDDLAIVFTNMGVQLPGGVGTQLADRKSCTMRIPATIAKGEYIGRLTQEFTYGVTKTRGSNGSVATRSTFFGFNVSPYTWTVPQGLALNEPLLTQRREDLFAVNTPWYLGWCSPNRSLKGFYQANMAVSGQRNNRNEDLILFVDGVDLKYEVLAGWYTC